MNNASISEATFGSERLDIILPRCVDGQWKGLRYGKTLMWMP